MRISGPLELWHPESVKYYVMTLHTCAYVNILTYWYFGEAFRIWLLSMGMLGVYVLYPGRGAGHEFCSKTQ